MPVSVIDTGIGIPEDQQSKLFQPFQRAGQEAGPIEGTGIGLVITRQLVHLMSGEIGFETTPGSGSHFWIELPVHADRKRLTLQPSAAEQTQERISEQGTHLVLYVEDNAANIRFMRDLLGTFDDVDLVTMPTAELGIELAAARRPAVIIMDINLPRMSGLDALRALRQLPETRDIPVIALSAAVSTRDKQLGLQAGFYRYLTKPLRVDDLVSALEELLVV